MERKSQNSSLYFNRNRGRNCYARAILVETDPARRLLLPPVKEMSYHGVPTDYKLRIALSYIGPLRIELIEAAEGDSIYADFIKE